MLDLEITSAILLLTWSSVDSSVEKDRWSGGLVNLGSGVFFIPTAVGVVLSVFVGGLGTPLGSSDIAEGGSLTVDGSFVWSSLSMSPLISGACTSLTVQASDAESCDDGQ